MCQQGPENRFMQTSSEEQGGVNKHKNVNSQDRSTEPATNPVFRFGKAAFVQRGTSRKGGLSASNWNGNVDGGLGERKVRGKRLRSVRFSGREEPVNDRPEVRPRGRI